MSLILDALKRAERERNAERTPVLAELPRLAGAGPRRRWRIAGVGLLLVIAGLLAWSFVRQPPPVEHTEEIVAQTPAPAEPQLAAPPVEIPAPAPVIPGTEALESLDELAGQAAEAIAGEPAADAPPPAAAPQAAPAEKAAAEPKPEPEPPAPAAAPAETSPPPQVPPQLAQPAALRSFREMSPAYRADFPKITVEVHIYDRDAARRLVMINGRRYRQGERLSEGPLVAEITRDGIVFEHRGETFLYEIAR